MIPKPAAIVSTPTPSIINDFAACIVCLELSILADPTAFSPTAIPNNFPAIVAIPFPANLVIADPNVCSAGATDFTILKPL